MFPRDQRVIAFSAFGVRDLSDNDYVEVSPLTGRGGKVYSYPGHASTDGV